MAETKNLDELCVLLVSEQYGQLPSRVFATLLSKGRLTLARLAQNTSMSQRYVRHGLVLLIQQNLIFHHTDPETGITYYEANVDAAYNLVRTGKILENIRRRYGEGARSIVQNIIVHGSMTVGAITRTYKQGHPRPESAANGHVNGSFLDASTTAGDEETDPAEEALETVARLIAIGILEPLTKRMLQSPEDLRQEVEHQCMKDYPTGIHGSRAKAEFVQKTNYMRRQILDESKSLRRQLERDYLYGPAVKRRKLANGAAGGFAAVNHIDGLEPDVTLRLSYQKCLVELRSQKLVQYVDDAISPVTAQVYSALLSALDKKLDRCQADEDGDGAVDMITVRSVTTSEVYEHLKPSVDVFAGIGKCPADEIDIASAERIQGQPPGVGDVDEDGEDLENETEDVDASTGPRTNGYAQRETKIQETPNAKVRFADKVPTKAERMEQMRQHLLVLAESSQQFVRHCGTRDNGEWTVDFDLIVRKMRVQELDTLIEASFGRQGRRLVKILTEKGKLDDRTLPAVSLMKKADCHMKLAQMELAGFLDVQEVPRDSNRDARRTIFLWFFDLEKTLKRTLDNTYKAMVRHLQRLEVERRKKRNVLAVAERKDVQGHEEEKLRGDVYNEYQEFLDIQSKLVGQIHRLDDLVGVFRDF